MPELNNIQIIGHVGGEPEMRFTPNGRPVTNFNVAVNRTYTTNDGGKKKETEWFSIVCWGRIAETTNQFVVKGMSVYIQGSIHLHHWDNEQGEQRSRLQLNATKVVFLAKPNGQNYQLPAGVDDSEYLEDVPF